MMWHEGRFKIDFGAMVRPISEQLDSQDIDYPAEDAGHWEQDADAITRLKVRGLLNDSQTAMARQKLMNKIAKRLEQ